MAKSGDEIEVWGDGMQTRSVADIAGKRISKKHIAGPQGVGATRITGSSSTNCNGALSLPLRKGLVMSSTY